MTESKRCVECGAENWAYADVCWLCKRDLSDVEAIITAELVKPPVHSATDMFFAIVCGLLAILLSLVGIGLFIEEPGAGITYIILVAPPLVITIIRTALKQQRAGYVGWGERLATFVVSGVAFAGILALLAVGAIVAFFVYCLYSLR